MEFTNLMLIYTEPLYWEPRPLFHAEKLRDFYFAGPQKPALCNARMLGFQWVNLGGSELRSLYHFKAKLSRINSEHVYTTRHVLDLEWRGV
jgi:hypothetical protein